MAERPLPRGIATSAHADYIVRPLRDPVELRAILSPHRDYAAYALGQLQPDLFARSEWWVARGAQGQALLLHSQGGLGSALFALGAPEALEALLRLHPGPSHTFLTGQPQQLDVLLRHFHLPEDNAMVRLQVDRERFRPVVGDARRLRGSDARHVNRLYRADGTPAFYSAENIEDAVYFGAYQDGRLVAVAGTHVVTQAEGIGVIGNVFAHPAYRGRGLGTVVTSAVTSEVLASCREAVLSVDPGNDHALRAYRRLGFREVGRLIEGPAVRRDMVLGAFLRRRVAALRGRRYGAELVSLPA
jgi:ribosomal protein S18 acetylase RimI-like enzyme